MKFLKEYFFAFLVFSLGSLSAQTFIGKINPFPQLAALNRSSSDTIKILAVMVEFQKDTDNNTAGDGTFNSIYEKDYGDKIIDPLPHDVSYFANHVEFAKNYFSKVSNGKANVVYQILPQVITVSKTMRNYSPAVNSTDFTAMAEFMKEVWTLAGNQNPNFNFADFNLFSIFHAGVGRDISLPGSLGNEKDLPSVYLGLNSLQKYFGASFDGIQVGSSNFKITNSMILPQAENREITSFGQTSLFQVSINGLIVANIASFLGLPDLFDTNTGLSAIGKFGLMDGQSIFANRGLFPPEPSAWEKIFLGWETPIEIAVQAGTTTHTIAPSLIPSHQIYKIPINASEYYLVEYRQRDVNQDGLKITLKQSGSDVLKTFGLAEYDYFEAIPETLIAGVTTSVDEYDFSLPGSGLLIWHIDEKIINEKITENKINSDKTRRGVDLEEADGVQDIGEQFTTIFGDQVVGEGWEFDLWYKTNTAKLYQNKFSSDTRPNTNANDGANSLITFQNFSDLTNPTQMTFDVQFGGDVVKPIFRKNLPNIGSKNKILSPWVAGEQKYFLLSNQNLYSYDQAGNLLDSTIKFSSFKPVPIYGGATNKIAIVGIYNDGNSASINVLNYSGTQKKIFSKSYADSVTTPPISTLRVSSTPFITTSEIKFGDSKGNIITAILYEDSLSIEEVFQVPFTNLPITKIAGDSGNTFISGNIISSFPTLNSYAIDNQIVDIAQTTDRHEKEVSVLLSDNKFSVMDAHLNLISQFSVPQSPESFSLDNIFCDDVNYILFTNGNEIEGRNITGAYAENFLIRDPKGIGFRGLPLTTFDELFAGTSDGRIFAFNKKNGKVVDGFPISFGEPISTMMLTRHNNQCIVVGEKTFAVYQVSEYSILNVSWGEENSNLRNSSFNGGWTVDNPNPEFFPKTKAYNWPNPVYDGQTFIRYYVSEDSKINIKIFDLAGDFVAELNNTAIGGMDNETTWNVNNIQSGVYFARLEATGNSGKSESTIIKIAIVK